ncbi:hypothetical protein PM082_022630 [Marasmius tenuissimus]|nr:hypothetical protein PM082_022630 [Marasmius tenuissimus]
MVIHDSSSKTLDLIGHVSPFPPTCRFFRYWRNGVVIPANVAGTTSRQGSQAGWGSRMTQVLMLEPRQAQERRACGRIPAAARLRVRADIAMVERWKRTFGVIMET